MRILQLCKKFPYPPKDGEAIAILNLTRSLSDLGHEVTVLAMNTRKHYFNLRELPDSVRRIAKFHAVDIQPDVNLWDAFKNLFSRKSYHIDRFDSLAYRAKLAELLTEQEFDVIQLETVYLGPYVQQIRRYSNAGIVLRAHNVEHEIWERLTANQHPGLKKSYLKLLTKRLKAFEVSNLLAYDLLVPITARDEARFHALGWSGPSHVLPVGIDIEGFTNAKNPPVSPSLFFIGGMDWMPNLEGVKWFLKQVWPKLISQHPGLTFNLAGRNMPQEFAKSKIEGFNVLGEVDNAHAFMHCHPIMIVPLFSGSGMRIKIIEAMALKRGIISTTIGAEGIACKDREHLMIANTAPEFVEAISSLIRDRNLLEDMGNRARKLIETKYDNLTLTRELVAFYERNIAG